MSGFAVAGGQQENVGDVILCYDVCYEVDLRMQTRPAIEFVSGKEGLRPKFYFLVYTFLEYTFTDALKYENAPGPHRGAEGRWRCGRFAVLLLGW